jgi:hypothetical protein
MFPVIDMGRIIVLAIKISLFIGFSIYFFSFVDVITVTLSDILGNVKSSLSVVSSLDLGCFSDGIGMTDFLNSVINQFIIVVTFTISAIGSLIMYNTIIRFFGILMGM